MPMQEEIYALQELQTPNFHPESDTNIDMLTAETIEKLRILEIGDNSLFKRTYPDQTTLIWGGGHSPPSSLTEATATPEIMLRVLRDVHMRRYDIVVAYPPLYSPVHPRYWGRSIFRRPWRPWSALTRCFGTSYLRFTEFPAPLVIVDLGDSAPIGSPTAALLDNAKFAFKRELPTDRWRLLSGVAHPHLPTQRIRRSPKWARRIAKFRPINLPAFLWKNEFASDVFPEKTFDVFFAGSVAGNSTLRADGRAELDRLRGLGVTIDCADQQLSDREFFARMSRAWLAWSPEGLGWQCYRHAEAGLCQSVPIMNYPTILRATPLEEGVHAFYYPPEPGGLTRTIVRALADKERLKRMAASARAHCAAHFTVKACCDYILSTTLGAPS